MSERHVILIVDDEANIRKVLSVMLRKQYEVVQAKDGAEAIGILKRRSISVVISDMRMPQIDGMTLLKFIHRHYRDIPVIMLTAFATVDTAVEALKLGAFDYMMKPFDRSVMKETVAKAVRQYEQNCREFTGVGLNFQSRFGMIGRSPKMQKIFQIIERVADTPSTVLVTGESGTGKELIAKALHEHSRRRAKPFIKINCAAIPKDLVESELFGHEKGAFTGAVYAKPGRFELAHQGTLFLDEIGEIPMEMQVKLLRVLQESEFERVGGTKTIRVDVRVIAATHRNLKKEVEEGRFREDLYYRIHVVPIDLPPLRERSEDIEDLAHFFISKNNERLGKEVRGLTERAVEALKRYTWPGNIRELENLMERTMLFLDGTIIDIDDLPEEILENTGFPILPIHLPPAPSGGGGLKEVVKETTHLLERQYIIQALRDTKGNVTQAAKKLQISRKSLQNKMKEFGLRNEVF